MRAFHPDVPFSPRRLPFFYGWVILVVAILGVLASIPGQTIGVSVFTEPLMGATGLSRLWLSNAYLVGTLLSGFTLPLGGRLLDRFGARKTALGAALGLGLTLVWLSHADRVAATVSQATRGPAVGVAWVAIALGFVALRFSGQGMLTMVSRTMLGKWFERRRGLTAGISGVFVAFGFAIAPQALDAWTGWAGWRVAWLEMAALVGVAVGAVVWLFFRDNPEECGLRMDGDAVEKPRAEHASTRTEALHTISFWAIALTLAVHAMAITGVTFHIVDIGAEAGLDRSEAVSIFLPIALFSTTTGALVGWIADRVRVRTLVIGMLMAEATGYVAATQLAHPVGYWITVAAFGVTSGFFGPLSQVALPRLFGRLHLGAISGVMLMMTVVGSALGPSAFALSDRVTASYALALYLSGCLPVAVGVLAWLGKHPRDVPPHRVPSGG